MRLEVHPFDAGRKADFYRLHGSFALPDHPGEGGGWCFCAAWWVPTWDGWGDRTAEENRRVRESLCERGEYDGYLLYAQGEPAGWCQVGPRDRLPKLCAQMRLAPDPDAWAITCFLIAPAHRRKGLAAFLLSEVLRDLRARGVARVEAYPRRGEIAEAGDLWTGPESIYRAAGFQPLHDDPKRPVLSLDLG